MVSRVDGLVQTYQSEIALTLGVALTALALYHKPKPTGCGLLVGAVGLLDAENSPDHVCHHCNCHASTDFVELAAGGGFSRLAKLLIPVAFIVAHLDRRLCCGTVEAALMGAMMGTYLKRLIWNSSEPTKD